MIDLQAILQKPSLVAGIDEAGRGPLAGPVVAAAVLWDNSQSIQIDGLKDSKKLSASQRDKLYARIQAQAISVAVGVATVQEIDQLNILQATLLAMRRAVEHLLIIPKVILVDGNQDPKIPNVPTYCIVGGDASEPVISAASIIAKVTRDRMMIQYDQQYPGYGFAKHKGYGTAEHLQALQKLGPSLLHRRSFAPIKALNNNNKN